MKLVSKKLYSNQVIFPKWFIRFFLELATSDPNCDSAKRQTTKHTSNSGFPHDLILCHPTEGGRSKNIKLLSLIELTYKVSLRPALKIICHLDSSSINCYIIIYLTTPWLIVFDLRASLKIYQTQLAPGLEQRRTDRRQRSELIANLDHLAQPILGDDYFKIFRQSNWQIY